VEGSRSIGVLGVAKAKSDYNMQGFSGRFEAAFEVARLSGVSVSQYAAYQVSSIRTASFVERNEATGAAVGIQALAKTNTTARAELGLKLETAGQIGIMPATAFMRAGWGHYTSRDASVTAQIVGLPGSLFTSTGTRPDRNVALIAAGGEVQLTSAVSIGGRVDAELGSRTQSLSGSANIKYAF
jgi:outer membrane autotransporter protein